MTEPKQPAEQPAPEKARDLRPDAANGVPTGADAEAKGVPDSDRQRTETAARPDEHGS